MTQATLRVLFLTMGLTTGLMSFAYGAEQVGTITQLEGDVKLFTHPSKTFDRDKMGPPPHALYEGVYYAVQDAKVGEKVEKGNVLRTAPNAKARVVYENGDQFNLGSSSAYRVSWDKDSATAKTDVNLMYGRLRGIIAKGGPRSKMTVRTKSAVMGVRGTDFFIGDSGPNGGTEISVLRGEVEARSLGSGAKPVEVKTGQTAAIAAALPDTKSQPVTEVIKTSQEDLAAIDRVTRIKAEIHKEVEKLEKQADETTLNDIKTGDPQLYAEIQSQTGKRSADLNSLALAKVQKDAPKGSSKRKPFKSELEDLEKGAYEKYFKLVD